MSVVTTVGGQPALLRRSTRRCVFNQGDSNTLRVHPRGTHISTMAENVVKFGNGKPLSAFHSQLKAFELAVAKEGERRKAEEDQKFKHIIQQITRLSADLRLEVQERLDAKEALQKATFEAANRMLNDLQTKLTRRVNSIAERLDALVARCASVEGSVNDLSQRINQSFDFKMLQNDLNELHRNIKNDIAVKVEKDTSLVNKLMHMEYAIKSRLNDIVFLGNESLKELRVEMMRLSEWIASDVGPMSPQIMEEINTLKTAMELATKARKESDEGLFEAFEQIVRVLPRNIQNEANGLRRVHTSAQ
ncbi:SF-assemblin beta giardin, putative [Babesia ovata]|uniref:SF-assemblin beta giardin, putative n=1 Tax=Babesia ovata TaxID=189622 RepID=A0A2H6KBC9_9APIC|nr:SF-assemblin beta giardin, putative [Babesia ovata]GBE60296.1 SF-assemblin beta giardin, putative [Babesia ovata]